MGLTAASVPIFCGLDAAGGFRARLRFPRVTRELLNDGGTVQLQGLEAHVISQTDQEGKERLQGRFDLCHTPLNKALPHF
ncbi:hypothetical protein AS034_07930 [[Bacillus] enclensis]|nr:hypothetical protein AS034_07930 [[Bacillus] enclensis]